MHQSKVVSIFPLAVLAALIGAIPGTIAAQTTPKKESVWQPMKDAAKQGHQQPVQTQAGQRPPQSGGQPSGAQVNDTGPFTPPPGTKIEPVVMAPMQQGASFAVSPHGIHVATVSRSGSRQVIIYDGVAGPKFDQLFIEGNGSHPVIFSPDANHYAYCGAVGAEWIVMWDGKELTRSSAGASGQIGTTSWLLGFTSNSQHLYFSSAADAGSGSTSFWFVFDGKASPLGASGDMRNYTFSPDGNHFAYIWEDPTSRTEHSQLFIDNKPAPYNAGSPQWSADSQHLYTNRSVQIPNSRNGSVREYLLDGRPFMRADQAVLYIPPVGNMVVALVRKLQSSPQSQFLVVNGKPVSGSEITGGEPITKVYFSPDGKHYAAVYTSANHRQWVFSDGKKGQEYASIDSLDPLHGDRVSFTADSSRTVYKASNGVMNENYLVIDGQESDALMAAGGVFAPVGNHFATTGSGQVTADGKILQLPNVNPRTTQASALSFTPDGSHFAFVLRDSNRATIYLDGVAQTAFSPIAGGDLTNINTRPYVFSPDSKHIAYFCHSANPAAGDDMYLCVDDKAVRIGSPNSYLDLTWSADSNHLFWTRNMGVAKIRMFVDGKPVLEGFPPSTGYFQKRHGRSDPTATCWSFCRMTLRSSASASRHRRRRALRHCLAARWRRRLTDQCVCTFCGDFGSDGTLSFLAQDDNSLKRITITLSPETSLGTMLGVRFAQGN